MQYRRRDLCRRFRPARSAIMTRGFQAMDHFIRLPLVTVSLSFPLIVAIHTVAAAAGVQPTPARSFRAPAGQLMAQSGSMGGTIGNREKSLSGSRDVEPEQSARRSKPGENRRSTPTQRSGGSFDGAWTVVSTGCSGAGTGTVVVSSGRIIGQGVSGSFGPNGVIHSVASLGNGGTAIGSGRASGRRASGIYRQTDGCTGRFTAFKN